MTNGLQERWGRETRLLVLIVVVSLAVLLVLARFRFPAARIDVATPVPSPLANLVSRAAFEDLAEAMASTAGRIAPRVVVVRLGPARPPTGRGARGGGDAPPGGMKLVLGLRVRPDLALIRIPAGMIPVEIVDPSVPTPEIVGADSKREIALLRVPTIADAPSQPTTSDSFAGFAYLGEATATIDGPTLQPVFIGRTGTRSHERWPAALTGVDNTNLFDGSLLFTIDGRFVGITVHDATGVSLVPPPVVETVVGDLLASRSGPS